MREVRDRGRATAPEKALDCPVLLPADELANLFSELTSGLNFASVYSHSNPFSEGDAIQKAPVADKLDLTMKGVIEGSVASSLFDGDGTTLIDTCIVKDGVASSYFGAHRFAQYLKREATGNLRCMEVKAGTLTDSELSKAPYFECVSMSGLQVDVYNDYIGGEVRLAYYCDGETTTPVTGISISGKLSDVLNHIRLSGKTATFGGYHGPEQAVLKEMKIF